MTDYTKLIERLYASARGPSMFWETAAAIEALQATQASQSMQLAHDAVTIECLNDKVLALQGEVERLKGINKDALSNLNELCDAKNAEIADLQAKLFAAPKALEPLTRLQINQMMAYAGWQNSAIRHADLDGVEKVVRAVEASHGITKGTP